MVEGGVLEVDHGFAVETNEVVVAVGANFVAGGGAGVADLAGDAHTDEGFEGPVDSGARDLGHLAADVVEDLVGGGVIGAEGEGLENHAALDGKRESVLPAELFELLEREAGAAGAVHSWYIIANDICCQTGRGLRDRRAARIVSRTMCEGQNGTGSIFRSLRSGKCCRSRFCAVI